MTTKLNEHSLSPPPERLKTPEEKKQETRVPVTISDTRPQGTMSDKASASDEEKVTTYGHQDSLLPLPVPDLEDTLKKYLVTVKPFLTAEEMEHTEAVVEDFKNGIGSKLQEMLVERGEEERNWLEDWWENL